MNKSRKKNEWKIGSLLKKSIQSFRIRQNIHNDQASKEISMAFLQRTVFVHIFLVVFVNHSVCILNRDLMAIDVNDILSEKLMPLSLIYVKESSIEHEPPDRTNGSNQTLNHSNSFADFNSAFNLMQFHRKMIQKYKCNKYIARQILTDIAPHTLQNRLGMANINSTGKYCGRKMIVFLCFTFNFYNKI